jgi:hypothetical protein
LHFSPNKGPIGLATETQFTPTAVHKNLPIVVETLASNKTTFEAVTGEAGLADGKETFC